MRSHTRHNIIDSHYDYFAEERPSDYYYANFS